MSPEHDRLVFSLWETLTAAEKASLRAEATTGDRLAALVLDAVLRAEAERRGGARHGRRRAA